MLLKATGKTGQSAFRRGTVCRPSAARGVGGLDRGAQGRPQPLFGLAALYAYVGYVHKPGKGRFTLSIVCYLCSLLSKQMLVTLPFVLLLLDSSAFAARQARSVSRLFEKIPYFALSQALL